MSTTTERDYIPCGGCGSTTPLDRCIGCFHDFGRGRKRKETPPAEPAPLNNLFACPTCNGWHFNISRGGTLVCTSRGNVGTVGCGWRGSLEQPPRQEGEGPALTLDELLASTRGYDFSERFTMALAHACEYRRKLNEAGAAISAAERRAADAEAELAKWRIISDGDTPEGASERLGEIKSKVESVIAMVEQTDTLPGTARFVDKPHPDTLRLDWLQRESCDLRCFDMPTGQGDADIGWSVISHHMAEPHWRVEAEVFRDDARAAIDAAMSAPSAKGATP